MLQERRSLLKTDSSKRAFALTVALTGITTLFVAARFYCRRLNRASIGLEDWLVLASLIAFYGLTAAIWVVLLKGDTDSASVFPLDATSSQYQLANSISILWITVVTFSRCSLCLLYTRVFTIRPYKFAAIANFALNCVWAVFTILFISLRCDPVKSGWSTQPGGACVSLKATFLTTFISSLLCDLLTWSLPIPWVLKLHMPFRTKLFICLMFGLGLVMNALDIVRIAYIRHFDNDDSPRTILSSSYWACAQGAIAIITVCVTTLKPLFDKINIRKLLPWQNESAHQSTSTFASINYLKAYEQTAEGDEADLMPLQAFLESSAGRLPESTVVRGSRRATSSSKKSSRTEDWENGQRALRVQTQLQRLEERRDHNQAMRACNSNASDIMSRLT